MTKSLAYDFIALQWKDGKLSTDDMTILVSKKLITQAEADEIVALPQG